METRAKLPLLAATWAGKRAGDILIGTDGAAGARHAEPAGRTQCADDRHARGHRRGLPALGARSPDLCGGDRLRLATAPSAPAATSRRPPQWGRSRKAEAVKSLAAEYALNWQLECFTKPTVSLIDGVVIGSGVGISLYGTHRVAGERYRFAMPETGIGLFPGRRGELGLRPHAGRDRHVSGADGPRHRPGRCLPAGAGDALHPRRALRRDSRRRSPTPTRSIRCWTTATRTPAPASWRPWQAAIARCFAADTVEGIIERLRAERGGSATWARRGPGRPVAALADLAQDHASPRALGAQARSARHAADRTSGSPAGAWTATTSTRACAPC